MNSRGTTLTASGAIANGGYLEAAEQALAGLDGVGCFRESPSSCPGFIIQPWRRGVTIRCWRRVDIETCCMGCGGTGLGCGLRTRLNRKLSPVPRQHANVKGVLGFVPAASPNPARPDRYRGASGAITRQRLVCRVPLPPLAEFSANVRGQLASHNCPPVFISSFLDLEKPGSPATVRS